MTKFLCVIAFCAATLAGAQNTTELGIYSEKDKKFITCAAERSLMETKLGQLAESKAETKEVKDLGRVLVKDHSQSSEELKSIAFAAGVTMPSTLNEKQQKMYDKIAKESGKEFDKCYSKHMVKDHKKAVCEYKKQTKKTKVSTLKDWTGKKVPVLEHHLSMAKNACKSVKENK